jgi:hypothetical protein
MWAPLDHFFNARIALPLPKRRGIAVGLFSVNLLCSSAIYSQRQLTSFGRQAELSLEYTPAYVLLTPPVAGQPRSIVVGEREAPLLHFYRVLPNGTIEEFRRLELPTRLQFVRSLAMGKKTAYIGLAGKGDSLVILTEARSLIRKRLVQLPGSFERFFVTDLNNDTVPDIVLFGRASAGLATLLGAPGNKFVKGTLLFPEVSASDVQPWDLNGDGIIDLVLADWLTPQVSIFFGMGRGIFSEQVSFALPGEPSDLAITGDKKRRAFSIAAAIRERDAIVTLEGNALGELRLTGRIEVRGESAGLAYASLNGDEFPDLVSSAGQGILVALGVSALELGPPAFFGGASSIAGWAIGELAGNREHDLVLIDSSGRRLVLLANAADATSLSWPHVYAVGKGPCSIAAADLDGDGHLDLAVANELSSTLSVLRNKGDGVFDGQQSITLADPPTGLTTATPPATEAPLLIVSYGGTSSLGLVRPERRFSESSITTVTVCDNPSVLGVSRSIHHAGLELLVRCLDARDGSQTLSVLDQLDKMNFLERSIQTAVPYKMAALAVSRLRQKGAYDLLFAAHDGPSRKTAVYAAYSRDSMAFDPPKRLFSFSDTSRSVHGIIVEDFDGDGRPDVLVHLGAPVNAMLVAPANGQGQGRDSLYWIRGIHMTDPSAAIVEDVNGDGAMDITYIDEPRRSVLTLYGRAKGKLSSPVTIWQERPVSSVCVARLHQPDAADLILADAARSTVTVLFHPFRK